MRLSAQAASGSVRERVAGLASSLILFLRYRLENRPADTITRFFIGYVLFHRFGESVDQVLDLRLSLGANALFCFPIDRKAFREPLTLLALFHDPGHPIELTGVDHALGLEVLRQLGEEQVTESVVP